MDISDTKRCDFMCDSELRDSKREQSPSLRVIESDRSMSHVVYLEINRLNDYTTLRWTPRPTKVLVKKVIRL